MEVRRIAVISVVAPLLGCAGIFAGVAPGGPVTVVNVSTDTCGSWQATAVVPEHVVDWELEVWRGAAERTVVEVPARTSEVSIGGFAGVGAFPVHVASPFAESDPVQVEIGPIEAGLRVAETDEVWPLGEVPELAVEVVAGCSVDAFTVSAETGPGEPVAIRVPVSDGRAMLPTTGLPEGRHLLKISLFAGDLQVASARSAFVVGPPCVDEDGDGYEACKGDCEDGNPEVHPGAEEIVGDGLDNDCDGANGQDRDRDGVEAVEAGGLDCDDSDSRVWGGQLTPPDNDGDGFYAWASLDYDCDGVVDAGASGSVLDCDDDDPRIPADAEHPDPNGIDDDCDGIIDEGTIAYDDDGDGQAELDGDCNDADATVYDGARELADCKDNDCDGNLEDPSTLPHVDDRFEGATAHKLPGALKKKRFLGIDTGYRATSSTMALVSSAADDSESFAVWTHDGNIDTWHVTARIPSMGDRVGYRVEIAGEGGSTSGTISESGGAVTLHGQGGTDNTGDYTVTVTPNGKDAVWCPFTLVVSSG